MNANTRQDFIAFIEAVERLVNSSSAFNGLHNSVTHFNESAEQLKRQLLSDESSRENRDRCEGNKNS